MKKAKKAQFPIRKIIGICLILLFVMGVGVMASNVKLSNVKIILSNGYIMNVTTSKTNISEIDTILKSIPNDKKTYYDENLIPTLFSLTKK